MKSEVPVALSVTPPKEMTLVVALLTSIGLLTIDTYLLSFPVIDADFAVSHALLFQSLAFYLVAFAISTLVWGQLSNRQRYRAVLVSTWLLYLFASLGCALVGYCGRILLFRWLQGVAAGAGLEDGRTMIRDVHSP